VSDEIKPFRIDVSDAVLDDLRFRLRHTRWPEAEVVDDWSQGVPLAWLQDICRYWAEAYDWRAREAALNRFDQFVTTLDGLDVHFIHARSPHPEALPLIMTHGWPGSIVEFHKVIEPLSNPTAFGGNAADAFDVVCPSLPGYGFSGRPRSTGWGVDRIAEAWIALMARLGYDRYGAQGGDWGSAVTTSIGGLDPQHCAGIHVTLAMGGSPKIEGEPTPAEQRALDGAKYYRDWDSGYSKSSDPAPDGWLRPDRFAGGPGGVDPREVLGVDRLRRPSREHPEPRRAARQRDAVLGDGLGDVVCSVVLGELRPAGQGPPGEHTDRRGGVPQGIVTPVRSWMERRFTNITHWTEMAKGGHFAAFEQPELFVQDVRAYFRTLR
jgi:pimeloyl-ACP methyl ester carboxylesterase